jgi:phage portal protein BeeE
MAWYNPFSWKSPVAYQEVQGKHIYTLNSPDYGKFVSCFRGGYSEENILRMFKMLPEVFAPLDGIASRVCNGVFTVRRKSNDEIVYSKNELNKLLSQPNPFQTWHQFLYTAIIYKYVGNRYIHAKVPSVYSDVSYKNITGLWLLPPQYTQIIPKNPQPALYDTTSKADMIERYEVSWNGRKIEVLPQYVSHSSPVAVDPTDTESPFKGISPLICDEYPMSNLIAVYEARNVIYVKRGGIGALVSKKGDESGLISLTKSEKEQVRADFNNTYGVTGGKDPLIITDVPLDYLQISMSIRDLEPFKETQTSANAIAASVKFPRELLPAETQPTFSNMQTAEKSVYQNVVIKEGNEICSELNELMKLDEAGLYLHVSFDHVEALQEDKKAAADVFNTKATSVVNLYDKGFITKNRGLVMLGEEEVDGFNVYSFNDPNKQTIPAIDNTNQNESTTPQDKGAA